MRRVKPIQVVVIGLAVMMAAAILAALVGLALTTSWRGLWSALGSREMIYALVFTLVTSSLSSALVMLVAVPVAYGLSRVRFPGGRLVRTVLYLPIALPQLVLGLCLLLLLSRPWLTRLLRGIGLDLVFTRPGVVVAQFFTAFPYAVRVLKSAFDAVDPRLEFVSRSLGCSRLRTIWRVSLPLARRGLLAAGSIAFARCAGAFGAVLVLAGGTRLQTETLPIALYLNLSYGNLEMAVAAGLLLVLLSSVGIYAVEAMEARP